MEPLALHKWKQPVLTPMVGGARSHGNLRFASGDHNPFHRPLPSAVSTEPDRFFTVNHDFINDGYVHEEHHPVYVPCQPVGRWCQCHAWPMARRRGQQGSLLHRGAEPPIGHHECRQDAGDGKCQQCGQVSRGGCVNLIPYSNASAVTDAEAFYQPVFIKQLTVYHRDHLLLARWR